MITKNKIEIFIEADEYKCDFCNCTSFKKNRYLKTNAGIIADIKVISTVEISSTLDMYVCQICKKDICEKHKHTFCDHYVDETGYTHYNSITTCIQCKPVVEKIWEEEKEKNDDAEFDGRLVYLVEARLKGDEK